MSVPRPEVDDTNVEKITSMVPPACLIDDLPLTDAMNELIKKARVQGAAILRREDDRLLVIVGPCSIHDPQAGLEYAKKLRALVDELQEDLLIVMRVYFEKPRTTIGWKGLINDPDLDGTFKINKGLRVARQLLLDINAMGLPCGVEFLDTISPQFIADLVAWGAIGARTTESQVHRELASGLSCTLGFKNGTEGNIQIAVDACMAARQPHHFMGVTKQGLAAIVHTTGNESCHVILRGSTHGPNYDAEHVAAVKEKIAAKKLTPKIMIDCSHGNSNKNHNNQPLVAKDIAGQLSGGEKAIIGVMIESNLVSGRQDIVAGKPLTYGQSVTDACIDFETTEEVLRMLAKAIRERREAGQGEPQAKRARES